MRARPPWNGITPKRASAAMNSARESAAISAARPCDTDPLPYHLTAAATRSSRPNMTGSSRSAASTPTGTSRSNRTVVRWHLWGNRCVCHRNFPRLSAYQAGPPFLKATPIPTDSAALPRALCRPSTPPHGTPRPRHRLSSRASCGRLPPVGAEISWPDDRCRPGRYRVRPRLDSYGGHLLPSKARQLGQIQDLAHRPQRAPQPGCHLSEAQPRLFFCLRTPVLSASPSSRSALRLPGRADLESFGVAPGRPGEGSSPAFPPPPSSITMYGPWDLARAGGR